MKKFLLFLAVALVACSRAPMEQEVRFHSNLIESGSMTRAADHNEILNLIESTYTMFPIDLYTDEANNQFTRMEFGRTYTVPVGTWKVVGYNSNLIQMTAKPTSKYSLGKSPSFYTESYVAIQYGTTEYALPVEVRAAGIVYDKSEVSQIQYMGQTGSFIPLVESDYVFSDHYGLFFINGYFQGSEKVQFKVIPKSGANKETTFMLSAQEQASGSAIFGKLDFGKYYVLHPDAITELNGVSFSLSVPAWECALD